MDKRNRLRLVQDGQCVASAEGTGAFSEMNHYMFVYSQDGPCTIEFHDGKRWKPMVSTTGRAV